MSVQGNIANLFASLSKTDRILAKYVSAHPQTVLTMTGQKLAAATKTSPAAVSRFVRSLGYADYNSLKLQLSADLTKQQVASAIHQELTAHESVASIKNKLVDNAQRSLQETSDNLTDATIQQVVELLGHGQQFLTFGVGASNLVAQDLAQKWSRLGIGVVSSADLNQLLPLVVNTATQQVVLWIISNTGESPEALTLAKYARQNGVKLITTTALGKNHLQQLADVSLQTSQSREGKIRVAATHSLQAQLMLVDIIYYAYMSENYEQCQTSIERSRAILDQYKNKQLK
ncbi:MurR/RpiR family transcriptional regulator [Bombilactobacillus folatiphilus]|uniref:MurR/RpiR family transcriptional regulator n=1 Tax=Bombilactobacillus folatiphilus TaxID=2923362 RepID=A0ABY4P8N1_9LACO|nr:MurR/RpiR family transcriptional regulator [Bombilactobacillus folatiphilus]UQS82083.1 MurR/RpiR family transcriptional regulator [Bombilactobacillus folatiphilus]